MRNTRDTRDTRERDYEKRESLKNTGETGVKKREKEKNERASKPRNANETWSRRKLKLKKSFKSVIFFCCMFFLGSWWTERDTRDTRERDDEKRESLKNTRETGDEKRERLREKKRETRESLKSPQCQLVDEHWQRERREIRESLNLMIRLK